MGMKRDLRVLVAAASLSLVLFAVDGAFAQKAGGILKVGWFASPASMSILEESTIATERPMMGVFNNLVIFDQNVRQNTPKSIVTDLATSWAWNEEGTELTMPLRPGVKWHDLRGAVSKRSPPRNRWFADSPRSEGDSNRRSLFKRRSPPAV
jgi:peptide/nickel transport system substrate-binding protein